jgi:hypothetical protein
MGRSSSSSSSNNNNKMVEETLKWKQDDFIFMCCTTYDRTDVLPFDVWEFVQKIFKLLYSLYLALLTTIARSIGSDTY